MIQIFAAGAFVFFVGISCLMIRELRLLTEAINSALTKFTQEQFEYRFEKEQYRKRSDRICDEFQTRWELNDEVGEID